MSDIAIRVENLSKRYRIGQAVTRSNGRKSALKMVTAPFQYLASTLREPRPDEILWALKDISFEVKQGEAVGIIGHNGAGKSTLLKILSRITEPTSGRALINGRVGSLLEVGTGFHPELTGRENIYLSGAILGMKKVEIESKFDEIVAFAEVEKFVDTPVKRYSSGMYVRLAFAVAAHLEPEILLLDEVLAVGDAAFQQKCLGKMGTVVADGRTVLLVSHHMKSFSSLTQKCIWIDNGRIAAAGETDSVINQYLNHMGTSISSDGWADLSQAERHGTLAQRQAQVDWVRLLDPAGKQSGVFLEGEPITIELGLRVTEQVRDLQFGCGVAIEEGGTELFTIPSPEFAGVVEPGNYAVRIQMNPNHLRQGDYTLFAKLFAAGVRQDTISRVTRLTIQPYLSPDDNPAYRYKWVSGNIRFDYEWSPIESKETNHVELSTA
jgi:lipopolysaccharide transport system ATP-binding protein